MNKVILFIQIVFFILVSDYCMIVYLNLSSARTHSRREAVPFQWKESPHGAWRHGTTVVCRNR